MTETKTSFDHTDEALVTGYLDGVLTQADEQRTRLLLESSAEARRLFEQLAELRATTLSTPFRLEDDQWDERPRTRLSLVLRNLGLGVLAAWVVALLTLAVWLPERLDANVSRLLAASGISGTGMVLLSALIDRLKVAKNDIYRGVKK